MKDPYLPSLLNAVTSQRYSEQQGLETHTIKSNYSVYIMNIKRNQVRDD